MVRSENFSIKEGDSFLALGLKYLISKLGPSDESSAITSGWCSLNIWSINNLTCIPRCWLACINSQRINFPTSSNSQEKVWIEILFCAERIRLIRRVSDYSPWSNKRALGWFAEVTSSNNSCQIRRVPTSSGIVVTEESLNDSKVGIELLRQDIKVKTHNTTK